MDSWAHYFERPTTPAEVYLYDHLMREARTAEPARVVEHFRQLFVDGISYSNPRAVKALEWIVNAPFSGSEFKFILNRSYYIVINAWRESSRNRVFIPALIDTILTSPVNPNSPIRNRHLWQLTQHFIQSDQYQALRRLALTVRSENQGKKELTAKSGNVPLETIIYRYPYVYEHNLLTQDSTIEQRHTVQAMRQEAQTKYDLDLSRYMAYHRSSSYRDVVAFPAKNPTFLSDERLNRALSQYTGKVDGRNTQRDLANCFLTYSKWTRSYSEFKGDLYDYLTLSMGPWFGGQRFGSKLSNRLYSTLSHYDDKLPTNALFQETCKSLLDFLVVESQQNPEHTNFIDMLGNLGATLTINVLLKIILLCEQAKPWLERRFAVLFNHYGDRPQSDVKWLVESMETLNVAMSTNFSNLRGLNV
ncbi:MAG: hypothetical protein AAGD25_07270 [Cyanobacteria bacterium P01_F01_bin.150]